MKTPSLLLLLLVMAALTSCAGMPMVPLNTRVETAQGTLAYSSKGGLVITVDARSAK